MKAEEVIIVDEIPVSDYDQIVKDAVKYAIISIPFTYDRMNIPDLGQKILNIAKGKIAEGLFQYFCQANSITINSQICTTPFYQIDNRDFEFQGLEWDIKNNFLYHSGSELAGSEYIKLPALVPNRDGGDQWSKRDTKYLSHSTGTAYLFSFMKNLSVYSGSNTFFKIIVSPGQENYVRKLYKQFNGKAQSTPPFAAVDFWINYGDVSVTISDRPALIIGGYADQSHWALFKDCPRQKWSSGIMVTSILNSCTLLSNLNSFASLALSPGSSLKCAHFAK